MTQVITNAWLSDFAGQFLSLYINIIQYPGWWCDTATRLLVSLSEQNKNRDHCNNPVE